MFKLPCTNPGRQITGVFYFGAELTIGLLERSVKPWSRYGWRFDSFAPHIPEWRNWYTQRS